MRPPAAGVSPPASTRKRKREEVRLMTLRKIAEAVPVVSIVKLG
jgi:hypothetical protein